MKRALALHREQQQQRRAGAAAATTTTTTGGLVQHWGGAPTLGKLWRFYSACSSNYVYARIVRVISVCNLPNTKTVCAY